MIFNDEVHDPDESAGLVARGAHSLQRYLQRLIVDSVD